MSYQLHLANCRDIYLKLRGVDAVITDPPYGIGYKVNARPPMPGLDTPISLSTELGALIAGDDAEFDPGFLLAFPKVAIFGANHMQLPRGGHWIVWDKRRDSTPDDHPDCEFIWTNQKGADRIHRQKWRGIVREGEENISRSRKLHPNQKPVALLDFIFDQLKITAGQIVFDPFMGSGSTGVVALRRGCQFIGVEIDPAYYEIAKNRLQQEAQLWPS